MTFPPFINPAFANGTAPLAVTPNGLTLPRFQNWSVTYQRQLTGNMMLGVSYIGNRGSRLSHNASTLGVDANMNDPSVLALGATVLQANINSPAAQAAGIRSPYPGFTGNVAQALRKYPQYQNIPWRGVPTGESQHHAVETVLERRFSGAPASGIHSPNCITAQRTPGSDGRTHGSKSRGPAEWSSVRTIRRMCS